MSKKIFLQCPNKSCRERMGIFARHCSSCGTKLVVPEEIAAHINPLEQQLFFEQTCQNGRGHVLQADQGEDVKFCVTCSQPLRQE